MWTGVAYGKILRPKGVMTIAQGSIVKRGNAYYIVYRFGGEQKWERIGLNRRQAEEVLVERMNLINKGDYREAKHISFADFTAPATGRYESFVSKTAKILPIYDSNTKM
jgi:hypothetical protein